MKMVNQKKKQDEDTGEQQQIKFFETLQTVLKYL
jgi:hypothetical protein